MISALSGALVAIAFTAALGATQNITPAVQKGTAWRFAVSGDSRDCGDVVMPGIAAAVLRDDVQFYWHLGDFRKLSDPDEDIVHEPEHASSSLTMAHYQDIAWQDFIDNQLQPFAPLPVFLAIGNHEMVPPKNREMLLRQFANWFDAPLIAQQRTADDRGDQSVKTYYHWIENGVAFYTLDNATGEQFDAAQLAWFEWALAHDSADPAITAIVAGMHEALPDSISADHSMNGSADGLESGRRVYADLLAAQNVGHKHVYLIASHSHYFMDGIFNTAYWRSHGGVLPGWIIGTAGAVRYALPPQSADARAAQTNVYGYGLLTVQPSGEIALEYKRLSENGVPAAVVSRYTPNFVHWCFAKNSQAN